MSLDVIIIGAGPGGSTAAAKAAMDGLRVLLIDKSSFPRDKVCGDAVSGSCLAVVKRYEGFVRSKICSELQLSRRLQRLTKVPGLMRFIVRRSRRLPGMTDLLSGMFSDVESRSTLVSPRLYLRLLSRPTGSA